MDQDIGGHSTAFASTGRVDRWWVEPLVTGAGFFGFVVYTTWAMLQAGHYWSEAYLSPLYSPLFYIKEVPGAAPIAHAWFGEWPQWWPAWLPSSPAIFILAGPLAFRMTCYYYRKFYYRSYFATPPACAVTSLPQKKYKGETALFIFQNVHRYTLYIAIGYIALLSYDAFLAFFENGDVADGEFGVGVGTLVLCLNVVLLSGYTFGCHAFRHLVGGRGDCFSCSAGKEHLGHKAWNQVSKLNARHMMWAWISMIWVGFTDFYVRMVSMGVFTDFNTWD
jgi:hypothetical protein